MFDRNSFNRREYVAGGAGEKSCIADLTNERARKMSCSLGEVPIIEEHNLVVTEVTTS